MYFSEFPPQFPQLSPHHRQEWLDSGVDPELIDLNVRSLDGLAALDFLVYALPNSERRNDGRIRDKWFKKYKHTELGGWWCSGVDLWTLEEAEWGCFKPDVPRRDGQGKVIKYEHPPKAETELFALRVPEHIWDKIAFRYGVLRRRGDGVTGRRGDDSTPPPNFWEWFLEHPEIPLCITEGAKKAGAILTAGYAAVALPGVFNGYRQPRDCNGQVLGLPKLIPSLELLARGGRDLYFCYDQDEKPKTVENVNKAIAQTAKLLARHNRNSQPKTDQKAQSPQRTIYITRWSPQYKGADDLITAKGAEAFEEAICQAMPFDSWQAEQFTRLTYPPNLCLNQRYLSALSFPETAKLVAIKSPKGTGKTEALTLEVSKAVCRGQKVVVLTHRVQLGEALCSRFGIDYVTEFRHSETKGVFGYGLCIDSLHENSQARFNPDEWEDTTVIIDECEQVFWHLLNSSTCQKERVPILRSLKRLMENVLSSEEGRVFLSDADLSDIALNYVKSLAGFPVEPYVIVNDGQPSKGWDVYLYEGNDPSQLVKALVKEIENGGVPMVCCSAQKLSSPWGTQNLEAYLKKLFPKRRILRIDSETVSDPLHPAYGCIGNLNEILGDFDIVLASPSIETGVSIDLKGHFTSVWGIAQGVQMADSIRQALSRVRESVPRHLWAREQGFPGSRIGNGSTSVRELLSSQNKLCRANIALLRLSEFEEIDADFQPESLKAWAARAVAINQSMRCYRETIVRGLKGEGHTIIPAASLDEKQEETDSIKEEIQMTKNENYQAHCEAVAAASNPSEQELKTLKQKRAKTSQERLIERKGTLARRYDIPITSLVVQRDDKGWYNQLQLDYYLTVGKEFLRAREMRVLRSQLDEGEGAIWKPDFNRTQLGAKIHLLEAINIKQFFEEGARFTSSSLSEWGEFVKSHRWEIKVGLGLTINSKDAPIAIAQNLLGKLGLKMPFLYKRGGRGQQERVYGAVVRSDGREEVFERWRERDEALAAVEAARVVVTQSNKEGITASG